MTSAKLPGEGRSRYRLAERATTGHESTPGSSLTGPWLLRPIECKPSTGCHGARTEVLRLVYPVTALLLRQTQQAGEVLGAAAGVVDLVKISASDSPASSSARTAFATLAARHRIPLIGERGQIPAIDRGDTFNGAALDLDAQAVAGLLAVEQPPFPITLMTDSRSEPLSE